MIIYKIYDDWHGLIGIAKDVYSASRFLVKDNWITETTECFPEEYPEGITLKEFYGEEWIEKFCKLDEETFCDMFEGAFSILEDELIEYERGEI